MQGVAPPSHPLLVSLMLWNCWTGFLDQMRQLRVDHGFIVIRRLKGAVYLVGR